MAAKKMVTPEVSNTNHNTNNNNVNVHVSIKKPRTRKKTQKAEKPNWILKLIIGGIITIGVLLLVNYLTNGKENQPPSVQTQPLNRN